jgi:hypothetical protein
MKGYDGHNGGHCTECENTLSLNDCDAMGMGLYDRVFGR